MIVRTVSNSGISCNLININLGITHATCMFNFVEMAPNVIVDGDVTIYYDVFTGAAKIINPGIIIGANSIIASGFAFTKDIPSVVWVSEIPVVIKKKYPAIFMG